MNGYLGCFLFVTIANNWLQMNFLVCTWLLICVGTSVGSRSRICFCRAQVYLVLVESQTVFQCSATSYLFLILTPNTEYAAKNAWRVRKQGDRKQKGACQRLWACTPADLLSHSHGHGCMQEEAIREVNVYI